MKILRLTTTLTLAALAGCASLTIADRDLGLHRSSVFEVATPIPFSFADEPRVRASPPLPGSGMPPMISHAVDEHLPVTASRNECRECHDKPQNIGRAPMAGKARPAPANHYRSAASDGLRLTGAHYNCMACHAPQAEVDPLVRNLSR